jgi:hypothetical protein
MKSYPSFAAWRLDQSPANRKLVDALARLVEAAGPELERGVKWGQGMWALDGAPKVYLHAEPDHVQLGFYGGAALRDPEGLLRGSGKYVRHVRVTSTRGIPRQAVAALLEQVLSGS